MPEMTPEAGEPRSKAGQPLYTTPTAPVQDLPSRPPKALESELPLYMMAMRGASSSPESGRVIAKSQSVGRGQVPNDPEVKLTRVQA